MDCTKINEKEKDFHFTSKTFKIILTWLKYVVKDEYIRVAYKDDLCWIQANPLLAREGRKSERGKNRDR